MDTSHFEEFQELVFSELKSSGWSWGIGKYLEERSLLLRNYPQIVSEGRIYHLGLDIIVPKGYKLHAPISGVVHLTGKEEGTGNYGGYVVLKHEGADGFFYSFYGHLNSHHMVNEGHIVKQGESFAEIGDGEDSGGWFTHTHLQVITEKAERMGRMFHGYASEKDLREIESLFPNPGFLFRY